MKEGREVDRDEYSERVDQTKDFRDLVWQWWVNRIVDTRSALCWWEPRKKVSGAFNGAQALLGKNFPTAKYQYWKPPSGSVSQELAREGELLVREALELVRNIAVFIKESGKWLHHYNIICNEIAASVEDGWLEYTRNWQHSVHPDG